MTATSVTTGMMRPAPSTGCPAAMSTAPIPSTAINGRLVSTTRRHGVVEAVMSGDPTLLRYRAVARRQRWYGVRTTRPNGHDRFRRLSTFTLWCSVAGLLVYLGL